MGAQGGGRGQAVLLGGRQEAAGASSPGSWVTPRLQGGSRGAHRPLVGSTGIASEPRSRDGAVVLPVHQRSPRPGGSGPPHPTAGPWEEEPQTRWASAREILIYEQQNLPTPSPSGEGDVFSLARCRSRGCFELEAFLSPQPAACESGEVITPASTQAITCPAGFGINPELRLCKENKDGETRQGKRNNSPCLAQMVTQVGDGQHSTGCSKRTDPPGDGACQGRGHPAALCRQLPQPLTDGRKEKPCSASSSSSRNAGQALTGRVWEGACCQHPGYLGGCFLSLGRGTTAQTPVKFSPEPQVAKRELIRRRNESQQGAQFTRELSGC